MENLLWFSDFGHWTLDVGLSRPFRQRGQFHQRLRMSDGNQNIAALDGCIAARIEKYFTVAAADTDDNDIQL